jgi:hypothetical protein
VEVKSGSNSYFNLTNNLGLALDGTVPKYPLHVGRVHQLLVKQLLMV